MEREKVVSVMEASAWKAAEVICDISKKGVVVFPDERIIVKLNGYEEYIELEGGSFWTICQSLQEFKDTIVCGREAADSAGVKYYVSCFKEVREFKV